MIKDSIKNKILSYLTEKRDWIYGGQIEDFIRSTDGHKASNASRRCRELEDEGKIESRYVKVEGVANKVVQYRVKVEVPVKTFQWSSMELCCPSYSIFQVHAQNCQKKEQVKLSQGTLI